MLGWGSLSDCAGFGWARRVATMPFPGPSMREWHGAGGDRTLAVGPSRVRIRLAMPAGGAALHAVTVGSPHLRCSVLWTGPVRLGAVMWGFRVRAACVEER